MSFPRIQLPTTGRSIVLTSWCGTAVFVVAAVGATFLPDQLSGAAAIVDLALFAVGIATFSGAFAIAVGRSRVDLIGIGGLFFLQGSAPADVRMALLVPLGLEVVVGLATAAARVYTALAFGVLVPMFGLGLAGLWGARHGEFPPRVRSPR